MDSQPSITLPNGVVPSEFLAVEYENPENIAHIRINSLTDAAKRNAAHECFPEDNRLRHQSFLIVGFSDEKLDHLKTAIVSFGGHVALNLDDTVWSSASEMKTMKSILEERDIHVPVVTEDYVWNAVIEATEDDAIKQPDAPSMVNTSQKLSIYTLLNSDVESGKVISRKRSSSLPLSAYMHTAEVRTNVDSPILGRSFFVIGFDMERTKSLKSLIVEFGGVLSPKLDDSIEFVVTSDTSAVHVRRTIAESGFDASVISEDYLVNMIKQISLSSAGENGFQSSPFSLASTYLPSSSSMQDVVDTVLHSGTTPMMISQDIAEFERMDQIDRATRSKEFREREQRSGMWSNADEDSDSAIDFSGQTKSSESRRVSLVESLKDVSDEGDANARIEWQGMLRLILNGEVISKEKQRLTSVNVRQKADELNVGIWIGARAKVNGRTPQMERQEVEKAREKIDSRLESVMTFRYDPFSSDSPEMQVNDVLEQIDYVETLYPSRRKLMASKSLYAKPCFQNRLDALTTWATMNRSMMTQLRILQNWTGDENLSLSWPHSKYAQSFVESLLKESGIQRTFEKRILSQLGILLRKVKACKITNRQIFDELNLPTFIKEPSRLVQFSVSLMESFMRLRLEHCAHIPKDPPLIMVNQMLEDMRVVLQLSSKVKQDYQELLSGAWFWQLPSSVHEEYEQLELRCLQRYIRLLQIKIKMAWKLDHSNEIEILEGEWDFLSIVCVHVIGGEEEVTARICGLTSWLIDNFVKQHEDLLQSPVPETWKRTSTQWYSKNIESLRHRLQRLHRFHRKLCTMLENAADFSFHVQDRDTVMDALSSTGHGLVYTGKYEKKGLYLLVPSSRLSDSEFINDVLHACVKNADVSEQSEPCSYPDDSYVLFVHVLAPRWSGLTSMTATIEDHSVQLSRPPKMRLVSHRGASLVACCNYFQSLLDREDVDVDFLETRSNNQRVHRGLREIELGISRLIISLSQGVVTLYDRTKDAEFTENNFCFVSTHCFRILRTLSGSMLRKATSDMVQLAIAWIMFICDECDPQDRRTFKWAVKALEFTHSITTGGSILDLSENDFRLLRSRVARCVTAVIGQFGGRIEVSTGNDKVERHERPLPAVDANAYTKQTMMKLLEKLDADRARLQQTQRLAGRVLDDQQPENSALLFLASSKSNVSIRWQKSRFLGGGSFGQVYLAINLDSGHLLAMKEIRFQDSASLSALHKNIKDEMSVMERLNHPNIVSYYGIEVHRDRVYIFMEYCAGGSVATLLQNGRVEDEEWLRIRAIQTLRGIKYLHDNNIAHRDIKPDNLLLDEKEVVKIVDFGAAKILEHNQRTLTRGVTSSLQQPKSESLVGTPVYMSPEVITNADKGPLGRQDIWSFGCCILELVTGKRPWHHLDNEWAVMYHIASSSPPLPDPSQISPLGMDFLKKCLTRSPMERPSAGELLNHPWLKGVPEWRVDPRAVLH